MISKEKQKYTKLAEITHDPFSRVVIADIYNSRDKKILFPKFLKALFDISQRDNKKCVNEMDAYNKMGLGGYKEEIVPYVVADFEESQLLERLEMLVKLVLPRRVSLNLKKLWLNVPRILI